MKTAQKAIPRCKIATGLSGFDSKTPAPLVTSSDAGGNSAASCPWKRTRRRCAYARLMDS